MATKLIGTAANQVPTNGSLGSMAFQDKEAVRVDNLTVDNNVGIGTSAPSGILDLSAATGSGTLNIISTVNATDAGNKIAFFAADRSDTDEEMAYIKPLLTSNSGGSGNVQLGHLTFGTSGAERMRISSSGTLTMAATQGPALMNEDASNTNPTLIPRKTDTGTGWGSNGANNLEGIVGSVRSVLFGSAVTTFHGSGGSVVAHIDRSSGNVGIGVTPSYKLHVSGDIYATGNVTAYSSAVAKDDIATIPDALDIVEQLRGVSFKWKESGKKAVGLIYEEVKEVIPELTSDEGGHVGVAYQNTVALLIEAVKTLSAKVKELEAK